MVHLRDDGVFPYPRDVLWRFLDLHVRDDRIRSIHPSVLAQRTVSASPTQVVLDRTLVARGREYPVTWTITTDRPSTLRWEIPTAPQGPFVPGSYVANRYTEVPGGTRVETEVEMSIVGVPRFLQTLLVRRVLREIDGEDLAYLRSHRLE